MKYLLMICSLIAALNLAACDGGDHTETTMTGTPKCTVTVNGEEKPCH